MVSNKSGHPEAVVVVFKNVFIVTVYVWFENAFLRCNENCILEKEGTRHKLRSERVFEKIRDKL